MATLITTRQSSWQSGVRKRYYSAQNYRSWLQDMNKSKILTHVGIFKGLIIGNNVVLYIFSYASNGDRLFVAFKFKLWASCHGLYCAFYTLHVPHRRVMGQINIQFNTKLYVKEGNENGRCERSKNHEHVLHVINWFLRIKSDCAYSLKSLEKLKRFPWQISL